MNSVKSLKEDRLQSHQVHFTMLTIIQHSMKQKHKTHTDKSTHSEMG